jgi:UDP-2,3-diacylglucosamine pyrophosphatase LpxH
MVKHSSIIVLLLALVSVCMPLSGQVVPEKSPNVLPRVIAVISDLHLGSGERVIGEYDAQEDFRWGEDFVTFLDALHRAGGGQVTLVVAGDMFELWESAEDDCRADAPDFGCSEDEARRRMVRIVGAHRLELQALGAFASRGTNQVVIVPGNHDAALVFPSVWNLVTTAARPLRPTHFELAADGIWISPSGNVVVEHGHQFDDANKFDGWPNPVALAPSGATRLRSPFGERLVREFFDPLELRYSVVDNITGGAGLLYGVKREGLIGTALVFTDFLKLLSLDTSWRQFGNFVGGEEQPPVWDVAAARASGVVLLENGFPPEDSTARLVREVLGSDTSAFVVAAAGTVATMSEDEIRIICQSRYVAYLQAEKDGVPSEQRPQLCARTGGDLGYLKQKTVDLVRGSTFYVNKHVSDIDAKFPLVRNSDFVTYVYGHTHAATRAMPGPTSRFTVINTGAWQRLVSADTVAATAKRERWSTDQVIGNLKLADLPACYSFVWIPFQLGKVAEAKLRYWALEGGLWKFTVACSARETLPPD